MHRACCPASHLLPHLASRTPTPQACCCLKQATPSVLQRGPHRPHGGRALSAALASPPRPDCAPAESPTVCLPEGLLSSPLLSFHPESPSQFPGAWVGGLFLHASSLSSLSWALGGPSVLRAGFKAHRGRFQSALHTVLPGHCACPVPCAGSFDALSGNYLGFGLCSCKAGASAPWGACSISSYLSRHLCHACPIYLCSSYS